MGSKVGHIRGGSCRNGTGLPGARVYVAVVAAIVLAVTGCGHQSSHAAKAASTATKSSAARSSPVHNRVPAASTVTKPAAQSGPVHHSVPAATPQTVGLPTSHSPAAEASVPVPQGSVTGWRPVFSENFPRSEWAPSKAFSSCAWSGLVTMSSCSMLPSRARDRWFAFPDGSESLLSEGLFEPSRILSIGQGGLNFRILGSAQPLTFAGAIPKLGVNASNTLKAGLYVIRFHADRVPGYDFVFNLWPPNNDISRFGYIQFPTGSLADNIQALVYDPGHRQTAGTIYDPQQPLANDWDTGVLFSGWHTAVIERTATKIEFYLDGRPFGIDNTAVPRAGLMLMLQTTQQNDQAASTTGGQVSVAWLKVYAPAAHAAE
jgi:hypothetical protein